MNFNPRWIIAQAVLLAFWGGMTLLPVPRAAAQAQEADTGMVNTGAVSDRGEDADPDDMAAEELEGDIMIAFGTLVAVTEGRLTVLEYDFDSDQDIEAAYVIDEETEYENITGAADLSVDDPVEIIYLEMDGNRIALVVTKEQLDLDDDLLDEDAGLEREVPDAGDESVPGELPELTDEP